MKTTRPLPPPSLSLEFRFKLGYGFGISHCHIRCPMPDARFPSPSNPVSSISCSAALWHLLLICLSAINGNRGTGEMPPQKVLGFLPPSWRLYTYSLRSHDHDELPKTTIKNQEGGRTIRFWVKPECPCIIKCKKIMPFLPPECQLLILGSKSER